MNVPYGMGVHNQNLVSGFYFFIDIDEFISEISVLIQRIHNNKYNQGQFEWVDNVLVKALERGYWLMISHANFCR